MNDSSKHAPVLSTPLLAGRTALVLVGDARLTCVTAGSSAVLAARNRHRNQAALSVSPDGFSVSPVTRMCRSER